MKLTKSLIFCFLSVLFSVYGQAQDVSIKGKVIDDSGLPIPGVTILIKGTTRATSSDIDGNYQIKAASSGTLVFSYVGYTSIQESIKGRTGIDVKLSPESQSLQEVVVVGYGTQKKSVTTGAISSVKAKDLEKIPNNGRIENALQGRVSGVSVFANAGQPGSSSTIRVRGITTFDGQGGNNPLWVVDGVVVDNGGIGYVNQSDIESIEVLKDAASQAIYGTRGASGVILVTTKKGKEGKISVSYNGFYGVSSPENTLKLLNATQYGAIINEKAIAAGKPVVYPNLSALGVGTDWQKVIFNTRAARFNHEVGISGGNNVSTFYASFGILDQEGIVTTEISNYNKKNIRLNSNHILSKYVTVGQTLGFAHTESIGIGNTNSEFGGPLNSAINLDPITPIIETDPTKANNLTLYPVNSIRDANGNPYGISSVVTGEPTNPLAYTQTRLGNKGISDDFVGNAFIEVSPIKNLKIKTAIGSKLSYYGNESFTPVSYLNGSNITAQNRLSRDRNKGFAWNIENTATYVKKIKEHDFSLLIGQGTYIDNIVSGLSISVAGIPAANYHDASFNFGSTPDQRSSSAYTGQEHRVTSLFSRFNYNYNEKYLLTGVIRRDGSSRFGANNKYGIFPSFSAGWVVSKESFWKVNNIINTLKIRGGYGIVGNDAIGDNKFLALIGSNRNFTYGPNGTIFIGNSPDAPANPDLKWEETTQSNIALETRLFSSVNFTIEAFDKKTNGILQNVTLPGFLGATGDPSANVANLSNKGIEIELGYRKKIGEVNFSINANGSFIENRVTFLGTGKEFITDQNASVHNLGAVTRTQVGQSFSSFYGAQTNGIFQTVAEVNAYKNSAGGLIQPNAVPGDFRYVDIDGNGLYESTKDKKFLGTPLPKYTFGMSLNADYKGFDLLINMQGAAGNKIFDATRRLDAGVTNYQTSVLSRWTAPGTSNTYPRVTDNDSNGNFSTPSDFFLQKGDYLRFKVVQIGYSLPKEVISKIGIQKIRLFITGENLLTLTKYTGFDPEIGGDISGIDRGYYPQARSFQFGGTLQF
ncbi:SusC/RagA family TonB-linked outer membrane protein [Flavobacterium soyangense]|uniref:TonB-dependent receptor n=1 Tax=Flavobacterium soyangense TaxID=2023265 RepID=A0A930XZ74_9FLAO|nr:TonB-dependent receptor [Flavobacterium soyangense]MBF2708588.1 TonB-dependent receptor [Flavobacterium soyangense]